MEVMNVVENAIKLQAFATNLASSEKKVQHSITPKAIIKKATIGTPVEHFEQRPRAVSNIGIAHFTKGVAVKIIGTENVLQRIPHLGLNNEMRLINSLIDFYSHLHFFAFAIVFFVNIFILFFQWVSLELSRRCLFIP